MRFNIFINQVKALEWDLNLQQAALMAYCYELASWAAVIKHEDGVTFYHSAKSKIISELPMLTNKPDTIYRLLKSLQIKGLIVYDWNGNLEMVGVTPKGRLWNSEKNPRTEKNPIEPGNISHEAPEKNPPNNNTIHNSTNDDKGGEPPKSIIEKLKDEKKTFLNRVVAFVKDNPNKYPKQVYFDFCSYWLEGSQGGKKLRFQKEGFFDLTRRLGTWHKNTTPEQLQKAWEEEKATKGLIDLLTPLIK